MSLGETATYRQETNNKMTEWFDQATCIGVDSEVFFPEIPTGDTRRFHWLQAKQYCDACPVTRECLAFQLSFEDKTGRREGYWGNMTPKEREQYSRSNANNWRG
jgi:hypothetical protein